MTGRRTIFWLLFAIALAVAAHLLLDVRGQRVETVIGERKVLVPDADSAAYISVKRSGSQATDLSSTSGTWRVTSPFASVADEQSVLRLVDALAFANVVDSMDSSEFRRLGRERRDFGLEQPRVVVRAGDVEVAFGALTPAGDGVYAAIDGVPAVYIVSSNVMAAVDLAATDFRSRSLFPDGHGEIGAFDVKGGTASFMRFVRDGDLWRMSEPQASEISPQRVKKFLDSLLSAQAVDFVWPTGASNETAVATAALLSGYGLDSGGAASVTIRRADGTDSVVAFGKAAQDGLVYALVHNGGAIARVDAALREAVLSGAGAFLDTRLFPYDAESVNTVYFADGDTRYTLARAQDGSWRLDSPVAAPADSAAVDSLVARLLALHVADLDSAGMRVSLSTNAAAVCVSREAVLGGGRVEDLRSREVARIDSATVRRVVVTEGGEGGKSVAVVYDTDRLVWNVESSTMPGAADTAAIASLLNTLDPLRAEYVARLKVTASELGAYGLDTPEFTIAVDRIGEESVRRNILIGEKTRGGRYATIGSADAVFVLSEATIRRLTADLAMEK